MTIAQQARRARLLIKRFLPSSLLGRSLMILIIPVLLVQIIATYIFFDRHWNKIMMRMAYAVTGEISVIAAVADEEVEPANLDRLINLTGEHLGLIVSYDKGDVLERKGVVAHLPWWEASGVRILEDELQTQLRKEFIIKAGLEEKWINVKIQLDHGVLNVLLPERRLYSSSGYVFLLWMIGSASLLLIISIIFMRNQIRPIWKLAAAAGRFGKGRDILYFKPEGAREVRQAGRAFLEMHDRIRRQIEQRTIMLAGVSHDLRTPLTRLKLQLAMMGNSPDIDAMKGDISEMEKMISGYLDFVRGENDELASRVDMRQLIEKASVSAKRQGIEITAEAIPEIHIMLKPLAFERCLANLVNNAAKYGTHVWIAAQQHKDIVEILIDDDGPGIPEERYEDVFKPFYRVDSSRNSSTGGVGLGLPIAMDIVHSHGGTIRLERSPYGGLRVILSLPL